MAGSSKYYTPYDHSVKISAAVIVYAWVAAILTFAGLLWSAINASSPADLYYQFAVTMNSSFKMFFAVLAAYVVVYIVLLHYPAKVGSACMSEPVPYGQGGKATYIDHGSLRLYMETMGHPAVVLFLIFAAIAGTSYVPDPGMFGASVGMLARPVYAIAYVVAPSVLVLVLVYHSPLIIAGFAFLTAPAPAVTSVVQATAKRKRPDRLIARELAAVLRAQELDDDRAARLFNELSPLQQWVWRAQYAKRTREAARVRGVVAAQTRAINEETGLARDTFEMERARRAKYDG